MVKKNAEKDVGLVRQFNELKKKHPDAVLLFRKGGQTRILPMPTSDTIEITQAALAVLKEIYREGISYKKTGIVLGNITDASYVQQNLFDEVKNRPERLQLMKSIDAMNHRFGLRKIHLAVEGEDKQAWHAKSEFRSGNYLSDLKEILTIQI
jgi:DNA polymerase V